jgi:SAM-dependent methyltransferase
VIRTWEKPAKIWSSWSGLKQAAKSLFSDLHLSDTDIGDRFMLESQPLTDVREAVVCSLCGAPPPAAPEFMVQGFTFVRCPVCGVRRVSPRMMLPALNRYYDQGYWASADSVTRGYFDYPGDRENIRRTFRRRLRLLERWTRPGRLLDVGCAFGFLLQEALARGWEAWGVEWSAHAAGHAEAGVRDRIRLGSLQQADFSAASLDAITFWDYLEHSTDPGKDLDSAARLLKPGGWFSVIIPDAGSWLARLMGPRWEEYKKPQEHLYFFTGRQLQAELQRRGFRVRHREWAGKYASLDFAFSRFKPGDGLTYGLGRAGLALAGALGLKHSVFYINPMDKLHILCQKERA